MCAHTWPSWHMLVVSDQDVQKAIREIVIRGCEVIMHVESGEQVWILGSVSMRCISNGV